MSSVICVLHCIALHCIVYCIVQHQIQCTSVHHVSNKWMINICFFVGINILMIKLENHLSQCALSCRTNWMRVKLYWKFTFEIFATPKHLNGHCNCSMQTFLSAPFEYWAHMRAHTHYFHNSSNVNEIFEPFHASLNVEVTHRWHAPVTFNFSIHFSQHTFIVIQTNKQTNAA